MRKIAAFILVVVLGMLLFGCAAEKASVKYVLSKPADEVPLEGEYDEYGSLVNAFDESTFIGAYKSPSALYHNGNKIIITDISAYQRMIEDAYGFFVVVTMDVSEYSAKEMRQLAETDLSADLLFIEEKYLPEESHTMYTFMTETMVKLDENAQQLYQIYYHYSLESNDSFVGAECTAYMDFMQEEEYKVTKEDGTVQTGNKEVHWYTEVKLNDELPDPEKAPEPVKGYLEDIIDELF